jgi:hypothetical protein
MLAQAGDNGNRAQRHLKPPRAALPGSQPTPTTPTAEDCPALAEPGAGPLHRCRHANRPGWISNNPAACGCGVRARNLRH